MTADGTDAHPLSSDEPIKGATTASDTCPLDACKVCTGCAHNGNRPCSGEVRCPTTGEVTRCRYAKERAA